MEFRRRCASREGDNRGVDNEDVGEVWWSVVELTAVDKWSLLNLQEGSFVAADKNYSMHKLVAAPASR